MNAHLAALRLLEHPPDDESAMHRESSSHVAEPSGARFETSREYPVGSTAVVNGVAGSSTEEQTATSPAGAGLPHSRKFAQVAAPQGSEGREFTAAEQEQERVGMLRRNARVPIRFALERLQLKLDSSELYLDLLIYVPFLLMFVFFSLSLNSSEANFYVAEGIRELFQVAEHPNLWTKMSIFRTEAQSNLRLWVELDKAYKDIGNQGDWASWAFDVFAGNTFGCGSASVEVAPNAPPTTPTDDSSGHVGSGMRVPVGQTVFIGAARFRTIRVRDDRCEGDPYLLPTNRSLFPSQCYAIGSSASVEETSPTFCEDCVDSENHPLFVYHPCSEVPGVPTVGFQGIYHCGGYIFDLPFDWSCDMAQERINNATPNFCAFNDNWATRFVMVEFFAYAVSTNTFFAVKYYQEVDAAGWWRLAQSIRAFELWTPRDVGRTVFEVFFLGYVVYYWYAFAFAAVQAFRREALLAFVAELWNLLELANLVCFVAIAVARVSWIWWSVRPGFRFPVPPEYPPNLDAIQTLFYAQVVMNAVNTVLSFLKVLKYVRLNAQLGVLTRTLAACQQSIFGILILFVLVTVTYAIAGWALFGVNMIEYCTISSSFSETMQILLGNSNYSDMRDTNRFLSGPFFWSFLILGFFLLLNFVVAVVSDAFSVVSGRAFHQSMEELLLRYIQNLRAFLRPSNLCRILNGMLTGRTEPLLIRLAMMDLRWRLESEIAVLHAKGVALADDDGEAMRPSDGGRPTLPEAAAAAAVAVGITPPHSHVDSLGASSSAPMGRSRMEMEAEKLGIWTGPVREEYEETAQASVTMTFADIKEWVDAATYAALTEHFFAYTWDEVVNDYDDFRKTMVESDKKALVAQVETTVAEMVGMDLKIVEELDALLTSVSGMIEGLLDHVSS